VRLHAGRGGLTDTVEESGQPYRLDARNRPGPDIQGCKPLAASEHDLAHIRVFVQQAMRLGGLM